MKTIFRTMLLLVALLLVSSINMSYADNDNHISEEMKKNYQNYVQLENGQIVPKKQSDKNGKFSIRKVKLSDLGFRSFYPDGGIYYLTDFSFDYYLEGIPRFFRKGDICFRIDPKTRFSDYSGQIEISLFKVNKNWFDSRIGGTRQATVDYGRQEFRWYNIPESGNYYFTFQKDNDYIVVEDDDVLINDCSHGF